MASPKPTDLRYRMGVEVEKPTFMYVFGKFQVSWRRHQAQSSTSAWEAPENSSPWCDTFSNLSSAPDLLVSMVDLQLANKHKKGGGAAVQMH